MQIRRTACRKLQQRQIKCKITIRHAIIINCVLKVGASLAKNDLIQIVFKEVGEIAKTSDFLSAGLKNYDVAKLCNEGYIERIRQGFYQLPQNEKVTDEQLIEIFLPQGIICVESALFYYGYSDFVPREWSIAIPRSLSRSVKRMQSIQMKAYYIQDDFLNLGQTSGDFNGVKLSVYDRERTICDCFKYRTKLDNELFNKAVRAYASDEKKNLANLTKYAKKMHLYKRMMDVMEVLLND